MAEEQPDLYSLVDTLDPDYWKSFGEPAASSDWQSNLNWVPSSHDEPVLVQAEPEPLTAAMAEVFSVEERQAMLKTVNPADILPPPPPLKPRPPPLQALPPPPVMKTELNPVASTSRPPLATINGNPKQVNIHEWDFAWTDK
jgi:hypothetical protein